MSKTTKNTSLTNMYKGIILIMVPILMIGAIELASIRRNIQKQSLEILRGNIDQQVETLIKTLNNINYCLMYNLLYNDHLKLAIRESGINKNNAISKLKEDFSNFSYYFGEDYHFFSYDLRENRIYGESPREINYKQYNDIENTIEQYMADSSKENFVTANRKWNEVETKDGTSLIIKIYKNNNETIGCWILLDTIEKIFRVNSYSANNNFMFLVKDNLVLTQVNLYKKISDGKNVEYFQSRSDKTINGNNIYYYEFYKGSFSILSIIDTMGIYKHDFNILFPFVLLLFIILSVSIYLLYYIRMRLIVPIKLFMDRLQNAEEIDDHEDGFTFLELKQADEMVVKAKRQIKELKIAVYEKELQKRKIQQDYMQVQIKPHFYLNILNIIYSMAQTGRYEEIQKLSMEVSLYMRSLYQNGMDLISVKDEINHLRIYLNIQEFRYTNSFTYQIHVNNDVENNKIPPLIMHTIVENSIKHNIMNQSIIKIDISVTYEEVSGRKYINITICDNGKGFDAEILTALQTGKTLRTKEGQRIGLSSMIQRLEFIFQNEAQIRFINQENGGAKVIILMPAASVLEVLE